MNNNYILVKFNNIKFAFILCLVSCNLVSTPAEAQSAENRYSNLKKIFKSPPASASPWVFWYWYHGAVSKDGITADLVAMKEAGIGGAYLMFIKDTTAPAMTEPAASQLSPVWWQMVKFAMQEAKRLNIKIGIHFSDGFALGGGPWITPALSMQKTVWTKRQISGGSLFNDTLEKPVANEDYYEDIAVFAYPSQNGEGISTRLIKPIITSSKEGEAALQSLADPDNKKNFGSNENCWIKYEFKQPFTCRTIVIKSQTNYQSNRLIIEVSDDGIHFKTHTRLQPPRHGWQDWDENYTHSIEPVTARYFRFVFDKAGTEPGTEDLDAAKWKPSLKIAGIELSAAATINGYEGKNGSVWRVSEPATNQQLPGEQCVPLKSIINITSYLDKKGKLNWQVPPGKWTILRMGHTTTGHRNDTGGGGKGLECDKFNPEAIRLQFNSWFGKIYNQIGIETIDSVLKIFHVDSWECGSQNWSPVFRKAFMHYCGYDPVLYLPAMAGVPLENAKVSEQFLHDIRSTIASLIKDNFYATVSKMVHEKKCLVTAESVAPTMVSDGMLHYQYADIPMGEFWLRSPTHDKPNDMLDAISGAHIYGKNIVQAEAFTELRLLWDEHPGMLKTLQDRNYALGINKLVYHVFMQNPWMDHKPGMTLDGIGLYFQRDQTWWKQGRAWVDYAKRCQALLQVGHPVTDVAIFTGEEIPRRAILPNTLINTLPGIIGKEKVNQEELRLENKNEPMLESPPGVHHSANMVDPENWIDPLNGYTYDSFNKDALLRLSGVKNGKIQLSTGANYKLLVLPGEMKMIPARNRMSPEVAEKLKQLASDGATIIVNEKPEVTPGINLTQGDEKKLYTLFDDIRTGKKSSTISGMPAWKIGKGMIIQGPYTSSTFELAGITPDFIAKDNKGRRISTIAWTHRSAPGLDIYFIANQLNEEQVSEISLRTAGRIPELWNAVNGDIKQATTWTISKGRTILPVKLPANGSIFIVLQKSTQATSSRSGLNWTNPKKIQTITGAWILHFDTSKGGPSGGVVFDTLADWSKQSDTTIRFYSGTAVYQKTIHWESVPGMKKRFWLNLNQVENIATVYVNNINCGTIWTAPFSAEITRALHKGDNEIRIEVTNTWANRIRHDENLPENKRVTNTNAPYRLKGENLLSAGLIGPVQIETSENNWSASGD